MLLSLLRSQHASLRSKAAELVATCVQNNPPVQQVCALFAGHVACDCSDMPSNVCWGGAWRWNEQVCLPGPPAYISTRDVGGVALYLQRLATSML